MTQYGWENGRFFVNSASGMGIDALYRHGWLADEDVWNGSISLEKFQRELGNPAEHVAGRPAIRMIVQDLYQPRGEPLKKAQANVIVRGTIKPHAHTTRGVPWIEAARLETILRDRPAAVQAAHRAAGKMGGRPRSSR